RESPRGLPGGGVATAVRHWPSSPHARCSAPLHARFDAVGRPSAARPEASTRSEVPFAGNVVDLDADAIGILEQHRVVAWRELRSLLGRMDDARSELVDEKAIDRIDVLAAAGA